MISSRIRLYTILAVVVFATAGCSEEQLVDPDKLCATGAGVAARISGTPDPLEMCVPDDEATATYLAPPDDRYLISATTMDNGIEIKIEIGFFLQPVQPQSLVVTSDSSQASADPSAAWFSYREVNPGVYEYSTQSITGNFRLNVTDDHIATGTFTNLEIELEDATGVSAGSRMIAEGFFSVTAD